MAEKTTVTRKTWGITKLPDFTGKKALVLPGAFYGSAVKMMAEIGCERAESVADADIVVFIGGVDVNPALYDQTKIAETQSPSPSRDNMEIEAYKACKELRKIMFGICRG